MVSMLNDTRIFGQKLEYLVMQWKKMNDYLAIKMTTIFGSMNTFWLLFVMVMIPIVPALSFTMPTIQFISSGVIQLVALPLILVGSNLIGAAAEKRAEEDHEMLKQQTETILKEFEEIKALHQDMHQLIIMIKNYIEKHKY
jgi:hypothetical protein